LNESGNGITVGMQTSLTQVNCTTQATLSVPLIAHLLPTETHISNVVDTQSAE